MTTAFITYLLTAPRGISISSGSTLDKEYGQNRRCTRRQSWELHFHSWDNSLPEPRRIDELWDKDGVFIDPGGVHQGVEKINAVVELLFTQFEGYVFSVRGPGQSKHGVGRLPWSYGPPDDPQRMTGTDVGVTKDGKLTALYVFIDPPLQK